MPSLGQEESELASLRGDPCGQGPGDDPQVEARERGARLVPRLEIPAPLAQGPLATDARERVRLGRAQGPVSASEGEGRADDVPDSRGAVQGESRAHRTAFGSRWRLEFEEANMSLPLRYGRSRG
jgi:hypothetical protein